MKNPKPHNHTGEECTECQAWIQSELNRVADEKEIEEANKQLQIEVEKVRQKEVPH